MIEDNVIKLTTKKKNIKTRKIDFDKDPFSTKIKLISDFLDIAQNDLCKSPASSMYNSFYAFLTLLQFSSNEQYKKNICVFLTILNAIESDRAFAHRFLNNIISQNEGSLK